MDYIQKSELNERGNNENGYQFLLNINCSDKKQKVVNFGSQDQVPVVLPNSNIVPFPMDMFVLVETESLRNVFPTFLNSVGIINT